MEAFKCYATYQEARNGKLYRDGTTLLEADGKKKRKQKINGAQPRFERGTSCILGVSEYPKQESYWRWEWLERDAREKG